MGRRVSQSEPKAYRRAVIGHSNVEQLYIFPPDGEDPTPMYAGLRTNLPSVSEL